MQVEMEFGRSDDDESLLTLIASIRNLANDIGLTDKDLVQQDPSHDRCFCFQNRIKCFLDASIQLFFKHNENKQFSG